MSKVLLVDDEPRILLLLQSLLKTNKYEVETARDGNAALEIVRAGGVDIMITDLRMEPMDGMALFQEVHKLQPSMPVILLTAYASVETAIEAMKQGMFDYLTKPFKVDDILACLARADEKVKKHESVALSMDIGSPLKYRFENLIGSSPLMTQVCDMIQKVAPTAATVLINGESGTGKEVIARTIHKNSPRAGKPWVAVNCAALPENLLESEMFGHMKGSFTGAYSDKQGLFEVANGGTLFLDEISSMPLLLQGKLLRVLQEREIRRVGGTKNIPVDVRVIAASNTNLEQAVVKGTFRSDLYYRFERHQACPHLPERRRHHARPPAAEDPPARTGRNCRRRALRRRPGRQRLAQELPQAEGKGIHRTHPRRGRRRQGESRRRAQGQPLHALPQAIRRPQGGVILNGRRRGRPCRGSSSPCGILQPCGGKCSRLPPSGFP